VHRETQACLQQFAVASREEITAHIYELDREWDIERRLQANASLLALSGIVLVTFVKSRIVLARYFLLVGPRAAFMGVWRHFHRGSNFWILTLFGSGYAGLGATVSQKVVGYPGRRILVFCSMLSRDGVRRCRSSAGWGHAQQRRFTARNTLQRPYVGISSGS
jgi:hypothetical protein